MGWNQWPIKSGAERRQQLAVGTADDWREDGEFTDKWDLEHFGSLERPALTQDTKSTKIANNTSTSSDYPKVTYSKEVHFPQKEAHPFIAIIVSAFLFLSVFGISYLSFENKWVSLYIASLFAIPTFLAIGRNNVERKANGDVIGRRGGSFYFWGIVRGLFFYGPFCALIIGLIFRTSIAVYIGAMFGYTIGVFNGEYN